MQAQVWATALDQDGAEPRETKQLRLRSMVLGRDPRRRTRAVSGLALPEVAAQFQRISDATCSPRVDGDGSCHFRPSRRGRARMPPEIRTRGAAAARRAGDRAVRRRLERAAARRSAAPHRRSWCRPRRRRHPAPAGRSSKDATSPSDRRGAARRLRGGHPRVLLATTAASSRLGTEERVFNRHQRRAIALRDGGCIIPGCGVPAGWCEIHHVTRTRQGRPDPYRQRRPALLVPPPVHRPPWLGDPDEPRRPRSASTTHGSTPSDNGDPSPNPNQDFRTSSRSQY